MSTSRLLLLGLALLSLTGCNGKPPLEVWRWQVRGSFEDRLARRTGDPGEGAIEISEQERSAGVRFLAVHANIAPEAIWRPESDGTFTFPLRSFELLAPGAEPLPARAIAFRGPSGGADGYSEMERQSSKSGTEGSFEVLFVVDGPLQQRTDLSLRYGDLPPQPLNDANRFRQ